MKRTEMLKIITNRIKDIRRYDCSEHDVAIELINEIEEAGMLPPETNLEKCPDPNFQIWSGDSIDIPHWIILGWDKE